MTVEFMYITFDTGIFLSFTIQGCIKILTQQEHCHRKYQIFLGLYIGSRGLPR